MKDIFTKIFNWLAGLSAAFFMALIAIFGTLGIIGLALLPFLLITFFIKFSGDYLYSKQLISFSVEWTLAFIVAGALQILSLMFKITINKTTK